MTPPQDREHAVPCVWCRAKTWNINAVCNRYVCIIADTLQRLRVAS